MFFSGHVADPERYGVVAFGADGTAREIIEKPPVPPSNYAVTGLYFLDGSAPERARRVQPSPRGELEITDLLQSYLNEGALRVETMVGGFFTLTNVSSEDFGEGSFDKGFRFRIPVDWLLGKPSRSGFGLTIRPTQRDGGQRVAVPDRLYGSVREAHRRSLEEQRARFWE